MSNLSKTLVVGIMKKEIRDVEGQVWKGLPDRVCDSTTERKQKTRHEEESARLAEECRQRYLATARARLARYQETGELQ